MFKRVTVAAFSAALALSLTAGAALAADMIQIKGSDTIVNLGSAWAEAYMKQNPKVSIAVTGGGSGTGFAALINGTADVANASRPIKSKEVAQAKERGFTPVQHTVALDGIAVIVHPKNLVSKLTIDQLADIFTGRKSNWKDFGGPNKKIVILSRDRNSGTHVFFLEHVLRKGNEKGPEEYANSALLLPSNQAIADEVGRNPYAIGYIGLGYLSSRQKALAVAYSGGKYIRPNVSSVKNDTYPISRGLFMYTKGRPSGEVKKYIAWCLSPAGQAIVRKEDFVAIK